MRETAGKALGTGCRLSREGKGRRGEAGALEGREGGRRARRRGSGTREVPNSGGDGGTEAPGGEGGSQPPCGKQDPGSELPGFCRFKLDPLILS